MVATPHVGDVRHSPALLSERVAEFNSALWRNDIELEVLVGAENAFHLGCDILSRYCINGSRYLLIEFPHTHLPAHANEVIFEFLNDGLLPIIAHPERNPSIIRQPTLLFDLVEQGALVQVTAESLTGESGSSVQSCARYLLKRGAVHFLASDGHSATWRPPTLAPGLKVAAKLIGRQEAKKLVDDNPGRILAGEDWPV